MYRFALSRKWLLAHAAVLAFAGLCLLAARWQLHRLDERRTYNRTLDARERSPVEPLATLVRAGEMAEQAGASAYRRAEASGRYDVRHEVVLEGRSLNGRAGRDVLTPFVIRPGVAVVVDRGWVPLSDVPIPQAAARAGVVRVKGVLQPSQRGFGVAVPRSGPLPAVSHVDLARIGTNMPYKLVPLYLRLQ